MTRKAARLKEAERVVAPILEDVRDARRRGAARICAQVRRVRAGAAFAFRCGVRSARSFERAVEVAATNIREYARQQLPRERIDRISGWPQARRRSCGRSIRWAPIFPAGRYPLPSTLLMTVIPAQVAGVRTICVACPQPGARNSRRGGVAWRDATCFRWAARRRSRRWRSEPRPSPRSTASWGRETSMSPPRKN